MKKFCCSALAVVCVATSLLADQRPANQQFDPVPQMMVANFFNILAEGAQAVGSHEKEDQMGHLANALQSISNIAQLVFRVTDVRLSDDEIELLHELSAKMYKACITNQDFIREFNKECRRQNNS